MARPSEKFACRNMQLQMCKSNFYNMLWFNIFPWNFCLALLML